MIRKISAASLSVCLVLAGCGDLTPVVRPTSSAVVIKHVVVIFGENISFDHYFGTYPTAANLTGESSFTAVSGTPVPAGLTPALMTNNPNMTNTANGAGASNPFRLSPAQAVTADQDHNYPDEQAAFNGGAMDLFPKSVGAADSAALGKTTGAAAIALTTGLTMGYYDGNTVTGLWNYAQHYALNDHSYSTNFGPSTPGAINLISGQTNGVINALNPGTAVVADGNGGSTLIGDADPGGDVCSSTSKSVNMSGKNIGDLLNAANVTWGFFEGGFDLSVTNPNGTTGCSRSTLSALSGTQVDYSPHHQPFQYYASTANPSHARPTSIAAIGTSDAAHHQYDMHDFTDALAAGNMASVSFLKAPRYQDAHAANSDPIDEQAFIINTVNAIEKSQFWNSTAVILAYDDSDGWYDHMYDLVNGSATTADKISGAGLCMTSAAAASALSGVATTAAAQGRCGYGTRMPLLVLSPWARKNAVDTTVTDQSSITRFIEDTFLGGARIGNGSFDSIAGPLTNMFDFSDGSRLPNPNVVLLNPSTGAVVSDN